MKDKKLQNMVIFPGANNSEADSLFSEDTFYIDDLDLEGTPLTPIESIVILLCFVPNRILLCHLHLGCPCVDNCTLMGLAYRSRNGLSLNEKMVLLCLVHEDISIPMR